MKTERPSAVFPARASVDGSPAAWLTMRYVVATARPTMRSSSAGVFARWEPVPLTIVTFRAGTCGSSSKSHGRSRSEGRERVMSGITTATRSRAPTRSRSGRASIGARTASRNAAASSGSPFTNWGSITETLGASVARSIPSVPYWRRMRCMAPHDSVGLSGPEGRSRRPGAGGPGPAKERDPRTC